MVRPSGLTGFMNKPGIILGPRRKDSASASPVKRRSVTLKLPAKDSRPRKRKRTSGGSVSSDSDSDPEDYDLQSEEADSDDPDDDIISISSPVFDEDTTLNAQAQHISNDAIDPHLLNL